LMGVPSTGGAGSVRVGSLISTIPI
jgi:hypothetical protein